MIISFAFLRLRSYLRCLVNPLIVISRPCFTFFSFHYYQRESAKIQTFTGNNASFGANLKHFSIDTDRWMTSRSETAFVSPAFVCDKKVTSTVSKPFTHFVFPTETLAVP